MLRMMVQMKNDDVPTNNLFLKAKITKITSLDYMLPTGREGKPQTSLTTTELQSEALMEAADN